MEAHTNVYKRVVASTRKKKKWPQKFSISGGWVNGSARTVVVICSVTFYALFPIHIGLVLLSTLRCSAHT